MEKRYFNLKKISKVIVQAGGKGTRMENLTYNRPKCLISIGGRPILYSISEAFGNDFEAIIIADYKAEILKTYLNNFPPPFKYQVVDADGQGTSSGIQAAIELTNGSGFAIVWSDLLFEEPFDLKNINGNTIGITENVRCRWSIYNGKIVEEPNSLPEHFGIPGIFFFPEPALLPNVPKNGEFVKFLSECGIDFSYILVKGFKEIGSYDAYRNERDNRLNSRFFNNIRIEDGKVIKESRDAGFNGLISDEVGWYKFVSGRGYENVPRIIKYKPLTLEFVRGFHPYDLGTKIKATNEKKMEAVRSIITSLQELHRLGSVEYSEEIAEEVYVNKTMSRLYRVAGVVPHKCRENFIVNGRKVMNILHPDNANAVKHIFNKVLKRQGEFKVIHGDPTFSNTIIKTIDSKPIFIDPRGYFGQRKIYGDTLYDFAKLYYSAIGNYDFFNQGRFILKLNGAEVNVKVESEGFEQARTVFEETMGNEIASIEVLHSLIWLSLSGYVIDDYDSILASYFKGLFLFQEVWDEYS